MLDRVGITGASGCGVTTLGAALAERLGAVHIDMDDHFWVATDPPYRVQREVPERLERIRAEQGRTGRWVVSGTLDGWAEPVTGGAELIVFLRVPTEVRLERLRRRERGRFGDELLPGRRCTITTASSSNGLPITTTAACRAATCRGMRNGSPACRSRCFGWKERCRTRR